MADSLCIARASAATMPAIKAHARKLAYLGTVDKILTALANEYGSDRPLPSRAYIQEVIDRRNAGMSRRYDRIVTKA